MPLGPLGHPTGPPAFVQVRAHMKGCGPKSWATRHKTAGQRGWATGPPTGWDVVAHAPPHPRAGQLADRTFTASGEVA
jgi:hypothetical protein